MKCYNCARSETKTYTYISPSGYDQKNLKYLFTESVCNFCASCAACYTTCKECGKLHSETKGGYCCYCCTSDVIHQFNYDPCKKLTRFHNTLGSILPEVAAMSGDMYYGVELEVCINPEYSTRRVAEEIQDVIGEFAILKYDGSINKGNNRGFEIVSAPASYQFHLKAWRDFFKFAERTGYFKYSDLSCGMHVHMSRSALKPSYIKKMSHLIYSAHNQKFIRHIANRASNKYCSYDPLMANHIEDHYTALNRSKKHTVELRIFQGVVDETPFIRNLEFCNALHVYASETDSIHIEDFYYEPFCEFIQENTELYPKLSRYVAPFSKIIVGAY